MRERQSCEPAIVNDTKLSTLQKVLLLTDGTLTQLLEVIAGEPIQVRKLAQHITGQAPQLLEIGHLQECLRRHVLLHGTFRSYVYAESYFAVDRLPAKIREQLLEGTEPIGRLWRAAGLETYRELLNYEREGAGQLAEHFSVDPDATLLSRTYLVHHNRQPLGLITEKFPDSYFAQS